MNNFSKYVPVLGFLLVVVAAVMMFIEPPLVYKVTILDNTTSLKVKTEAYKIIFGIEEDFDLNVLGVVGVSSLFLGGIFPLLKTDKPSTLFSAVLLIAGGVLMFVFPGTIDVTIGKFVADWPLIVAGIAGILAGAIHLTKLLA